MDRKDIIRALISFVGGIIISIAGLSLMDINQASATINSTPTRPNVAQRANAATRTSEPVLNPTNSPEPSVSPVSSETIVPFASDPVATPTPEPSPTSIPTLTPSSTPTTAPAVTPTGTMPVRRVPTQTLRAPSGPTATATTDPRRGDSPFSALEMTDTWQKLASGASLWFKTGKETSYPMRGDIWLDAPVDENGRRGLSLAVYSPEQNDLNAASLPKGRGSYDKTKPSHALVWHGGSPKAGTWYAYLTNNNSFPVDYKIGSSFNVTDPKSCFQYWEYLQNGAYILWTECNRPP